MIQRFPFFQRATLALLSGRDFRKGLVALFTVLKEYLGVEAISFDSLLEDEQALLVHYGVTSEGFFAVNERIALSEEEMQRVQRSERSQLSLLLKDIESSPHTPAHRHAILLAKHVPYRNRGYMVGFLRVGQRVIGHLVCVGRDPGSFTEEHIHLLETVLPACGLAMANMLDMQELDQQNKRMRRELEVFSPHEMVGSEGGLRKVMQDIRQLGGKNIPVLILGETGTGKELVANAIQKRSARAGQPFIKVNCGALADTLLDSELFGHEKGAFTGATYTRQGRFEQADGGTLFLDEVGELSPQAQVRLLRVLQDGIFERIGGTRPITVDVRIIAATNRNLRLMCAQKIFREDLFHRLNVFPINVPPLRERLEDVPLLIHYLAECIAKRMGVPVPCISMENIDKVMRYAWPGNVRELENLVERAMILSQGKPLDLAAFVPDADDAAETHLCAYCPVDIGDNGCISKKLLDEYIENKVRKLLQGDTWRGGEAGRLGAGGGELVPSFVSGAALSPLPEPLRIEDGPPGSAHSANLHSSVSMEERIWRALTLCNGKVYGPGGAAELLGINHNTLRSRMRKLGIPTGPVRAGTGTAVMPVKRP